MGAPKLRAALYVLCYHEVRWSEPMHLRGLGICHTPEMFGEHLEALSRLGTLVSYRDGLDRMRAGELTQPLFSVSFDDGYAGIVDHVLPTLDAIGVSALAAINPPFITGDATFWRSKLCWIRRRGAIERLAVGLETLGYHSGSVRDFTMDNYSDELVGIIDEVYESLADDDQARDRRSLHTGIDGLSALRAAGWELGNHSSRHLPLLESTAEDQLEAEFAEAEQWLATTVGAATTSWVAPFDRPLQRSASAVTSMRSLAGDRDCVLVGDRATSVPDVEDGVIYRTFAPVGRTPALVAALKRASRRSLQPTPHRAEPS